MHIQSTPNVCLREPNALVAARNTKGCITFYRLNGPDGKALARAYPLEGSPLWGFYVTGSLVDVEPVSQEEAVAAIVVMANGLAS